MIKFASLFSGGGGADIGAIAAGCEHLWGLEYDKAIAEAYRENIGTVHQVDILKANPAEFERPDWLHASPVCKAFSTANANAGEKQWDIDCGRKVAEFIRILKPKYFSLENVRAYGKAKAFHLIVDELYSQGYWVEFGVLNAADFGVPQSRKRLILRAIKGGFLPPLPPKEKHKGWYEAIADLVHDLPNSQLAEWQVKAMPDNVRESFLFDSSVSPNFAENRPICWEGGKPAFTIRASRVNAGKALLIENTGARSDRPLQTRQANEPSWTIRALGQDGHYHRVSALESGRVVQLSIRCLARLQSFPDWYKFPSQKATAGVIIGNSVPPLMMQKIIQATV